MASAWDQHIADVQAGRTQTAQPQQTNQGGIFGALLGGLLSGSKKGDPAPGTIGPNKKGMWTPSVGALPVGPATPINYQAIGKLLNSGALRGETVAQPQAPVPLPAAPTPVQQPARKPNLLELIFGNLGGGFNRNDIFGGQ